MTHKTAGLLNAIPNLRRAMQYAPNMTLGRKVHYLANQINPAWSKLPFMLGNTPKYLQVLRMQPKVQQRIARLAQAGEAMHPGKDIQTWPWDVKKLTNAARDLYGSHSSALNSEQVLDNLQNYGQTFVEPDLPIFGKKSEMKEQPMNRRQIFKAAFLAGCADQGLDMNETLAAVKQAQAQMVEAINGPKAETLWDVAATKRAGLLDNAYHTTTGLLGTGARMGTGLALGLPPLLGGALGYGAAALTDVNDEDVEETKLKELIDEHKRLAQRARMTAQLHAAKSQNVRRGRPLI